MRALNPSFERFDTTHVPAVAWDPGMRQGPTLPRVGNPEDRGELQKPRKQSQGVLENKGYHFFQGCKLRAFCAEMSPNLAPKGARHIAMPRQ